MEWDNGCAETVVSKHERDSDPGQSGEGWSIVSPSVPRFAIGTRETRWWLLFLFGSLPVIWTTAEFGGLRWPLG